MVDTNGKLFRALTGRTGADVSGRATGDVRGMLLAAFGGQKRDPNSPDTASAARGLGVSQRTVQRWLRAQSRPRAQNLGRLASRARQAASTKRGRARAIEATLGRTGVSRGLRVSVEGLQGTEPQYVRQRTVGFDLDSPELARGFVDAYVNGGDAGAVRWLEENSPETYGVPGWHIGSVDSVSLHGVYGRD